MTEPQDDIVEVEAEDDDDEDTLPGVQRDKRSRSWLPKAPSTPILGLGASLSELGVGLIETDTEGRILRMNGMAERLTGESFEERKGAHLDVVFRARMVAQSPLTKTEKDGAVALEMRGAPVGHTALLERRDGTVVAIYHAIGVAGGGFVGPDATGVTGKLVVFRDANVEHLLSLQIARQARYDGLTGLLNRSSFSERIEQALAVSREKGVRHALVYFDLDRFRLVNTTCGHDAGDDLLQWVATRLHEIMGSDDAAGRIGGDEFVVLLAGRDTLEAEQIVRQLQRKLHEFRFGWQKKTFPVEASMGLVPFGAEFLRAAEVLAAADQACRLAKDSGRGRLQIYMNDDQEMARSRRAMQWVASIQRHLADGRLRLYAQEINPLPPTKRRGAHFEVLVRVVGDDGQLESPVGIIQAAEDSRMMDEIDRYVVAKACQTIGALPKDMLRNLHTCAINLSALSLLREGLLDYLVEQLDKYKVPPAKICFEITETAAFNNLQEVLWMMQELGGMGCRFAIDDFGSGHASYGYLESLPVDYVKIDGMFVRNMLDSPLHRAIVESVQRIGSMLGIETVAESVETQQLADMLAKMGIHYAQGWLYGKPKPIGDVLAGMAKAKP
ncbi:putative bifunctional diguanylate cyclase/phosphodiesterase [Polyangium aurulentum]|uniref:putative bifunctional diguanylate cyclase/phosphodiesterase n=1 Tax=Polyangium aurulentum TaxID=2567896 RepID=UPI001F1C7A72|nr:EAL domain-containing protein [Polyangium aurulentum]